MRFDAHNHLQDSRFDVLDRSAVLADLQRLGVGGMVVNGTSPADWPEVERLASEHRPMILPAYGVHPWRVMDVAEDWESRLRRYLEAAWNRVSIGEIGLDRWITPTDFAKQLEVFRRQWRIAVEKNLPVTVHCLRAWGPLFEELRGNARPERGFLVHSPGASPETIRELASLGAYFSVSGPFADQRKPKYQRALRAIPPDRLLIETDAPDMLAPGANRREQLLDTRTGEPITHPADVVEVYRFVATFLGETEEALERQVAANFHRLFDEG